MTTTPTERRLAVTPGRAIATGYGAYVNGRAASSIECEQVDGTRLYLQVGKLHDRYFTSFNTVAA